MKKIISIIPITLIIMSIIFSCKKSDTLKDYGASLKDKAWWGTFAYTDQTTEYFSVNYKADSSFVWSDLSGNYDGKWSITDNHLKMALTKNGTIITADITDDDKLINISNYSGFYEIYSGAQIANPNIPLDNAEWNGTATPDFRPDFAVQLSFTSGNKVGVKFGDDPVITNSYTRSTSGAVIRTMIEAKHVFYVITAENEMKGSIGSNRYPFMVKKK